jgi:hypothetical protein
MGRTPKRRDPAATRRLFLRVTVIVTGLLIALSLILGTMPPPASPADNPASTSSES